MSTNFWANIRALDLPKQSPHGTTALVVVRPEEPVSYASMLMLVHGFSQIPVLEEPSENSVGVIHESGVLEALFRNPERLEKPLREIMAPSLPVVDGDERADRVVEHLLGGASAVLIRYRGQWRGLVTRSDLLRVLLRLDSPEYVI